jgi:dethiobiotin synthetase
VNYFVTAIDTDSGKTLVSAILCKALDAEYWKPIQAGLPKDSDVIRKLAPKARIHSERFLLSTPASPHASAKIDGVNIQLTDFIIPEVKENLVVEGAGGCLVPLNDKDFVIDLIRHLNIDVVLVADLYLGSINHTLLTVEALQSRSIRVAGIIFNGEPNPESERIILLHSGLKKLLHIQKLKSIDESVVQRYANELKANWHE